MTAQNEDLKKAIEEFGEDLGVKLYTQEEVDELIKSKIEEVTKSLSDKFAEEKDKAVKDAIEKTKAEIFAQMKKEKKIEDICQKFGVEKEVFAKCETVDDVLNVLASLDLKKDTKIVGASFAEPQPEINPWKRYGIE